MSADEHLDPVSGRRDRYGEPAPDQPVTAPAPEHDPACLNGWLPPDNEGHPAPCPICKPWLATCPTCGTNRSRCETGRSMLRGRCCPQCPHSPPTRKKPRRSDQEATQ